MDIFYPLHDPRRSKTIHEIIEQNQNKPFKTNLPALPCPTTEDAAGGSGLTVAATGPPGEDGDPEPTGLEELNEEDLRNLFDIAEEDDTG